MNDDEISDQIYEAAFDADQWLAVLDRLSAVSGSAGGELLAKRGPSAMGSEAR